MPSASPLRYGRVMRISCTDARGFECPACEAPVDVACRGVRLLHPSVIRNGRPWERIACHQERWQIAEANAEILTVGDDGIVANSRGDTIAVVVELTIDVSAARLMGGGGHRALEAYPLQSDLGITTKEKKDFVEKKEKSAISRIWDHYQTVIPGASRQTLESKRTTIIRNALKVRDEETCCKAIDGLAASPHHNGQNEQRKKYLALRYALKGIGAESNDERIDNMAAKATPSPGNSLATLPSEVKDRMRQVEAMLLNPLDLNLRARAGNAQEELLKRHGLTAHVGVGEPDTGQFFQDAPDGKIIVRWEQTSTAPNSITEGDGS